MGDMGIAWKVVIGLVLLLPMTAYVVGSLVAAAEEPREHAPIIVEERTQAPGGSGKSPSAGPTDRPSDDESDDHGRTRGRDGGDDDDTETITPSPSDLFDDHGGDRDDDDFDDNSGKGSDDDDLDDNSGKGSDDD